MTAPLISGGRVIKKTFKRSKGAVHVRDTRYIEMRNGLGTQISYRRDEPIPAIPPAKRNLKEVECACDSSVCSLFSSVSVYSECLIGVGGGLSSPLKDTSPIIRI